MKQSFSQKRIPTLLGLGVLIIGMIAGVLFLGQGFGAFSPRATAQTTPKNVQISNITDSGFTVSFITDDSTIGFIKYGTAADALKLQVSDDRDQISGSVTSYTTHYISVRELQPNTPYFFTLGTGSQARFDNNGAPYTTKTAVRTGNPSPALTIYGNVLNEQNQPASGSIVYAQIDGVGQLSSLVKDSGSWSIPLSNARTSDGSGYARLDANTSVALTVQGILASSTTATQTTVAQAQPMPALTLGTTGQQIAQTLPSPSAFDTTQIASPSPSPVEFASPVATTSATIADQNPSSSGIDTTNASSSATTTPGENRVLNVEATTPPVIETTQPVIIGQAPANVQVTIQIHSATQITSQIQADNTGSFSLDLAELSKTLEPGEHTITISYVDPQTGKTVTQQKTFTVTANAQAASTQQLALATSPTLQPYGTSNPFPATDTPTPTPTLVSTNSGEVRSTMPATGSALPTSGSTETTIALIGAGLLLLVAGGWSFALSRKTHMIEEIGEE